MVIIIDRSLFVHDEDTLNKSNISLLRVMEQLASQLSTANPSDPVTADSLFARMWDAQNPLGTPPVTGAAQCTGQVNSWPIDCRPIEGGQSSNPLTFMKQYIPIALVNRFDLRDQETFADCGEYRVIFANPISSRNFIIFEAQVPNPTPGVASGCLPIQNMWAGLSTNNDAASRGAILENFYFKGLPSPNDRAVIDSRNYAQNTGQIRTNQFMRSPFMTGPWLLKEYKAGIHNGKNTLQVVSVKSNPVGNLFDISNTNTKALRFRDDFLNNLDSLLIEDLSKFFLTVSNDAHNNGESPAQGPNISSNNFRMHFDKSSNRSFEEAIDAQIDALRVLSPSEFPIKLTATQVVNRATAMTCGGCHQPSAFELTLPDAVGPGQQWPNSLSFVHVGETPTNGIFPLSPALTDKFLPARKLDLEEYLISMKSFRSQTAKLQGNVRPSKLKAPRSKRSG